MSAVVDMMVKPILMMPPFFTFPPITTAICGLVELIKGGEIENIPGIGILLKYARESILILVLLIILYVKSWQYIGPKLWHFIEQYLKNRTPKPGRPNTPNVKENEGNLAKFANFVTGGASDAVRQGANDISAIPALIAFYVKLCLWYIYHSLYNALLTGFLQVPIDIMSWDMESLSLDFDNFWASEHNSFREDCRRFVNGSYAGDYSLYEKETNASYTGDTYTGSFNDKYEHSPDKYLCTHGNYCPEMSDVFGRTMMGKNASLTKDKSPTNGYVNGINITSAPRKYAVCCDSIKGSGTLTDCAKHCKELHPDINIDLISNPFSSKYPWSKLIDIAHHPKSTIEEPIKQLEVNFPEDHEDALCHLHNFFYDHWHSLCTAKEHNTDPNAGTFSKLWGAVEDEGDKALSAMIPCPESFGFYEIKDEGDHGGCAKSVSEIISDIAKGIDKLRQNCKEDCEKENNAFLLARGCNSIDLKKAKRSALRNRNDVLLSQLPTDYEDNKIANRAIKRTPWKLGERPNELNPNTEYNRGQQVKISASLTMENGTDCSRHDLSEVELDNCFGPFRPMTPEQYPVLFYKITKDFMGSILWTLLGMFVLFIILYILCLFNFVGRAAYKLNENAGMIEGGMESSGMNMDNIAKMIK